MPSVGAAGMVHMCATEGENERMERYLTPDSTRHREEAQVRRLKRARKEA